MDGTNDVHAALERLREAEISKQDKQPSQPLTRPREPDGTLAFEMQPRVARPDGPFRRLFDKLAEPFLGIGAIIHELSPAGLAERRVPFTHALKMPMSVLMASVIINLFGLALPLVILQVYDRVIPNEAIETFSLMMVGLGVVVILEGILRIARSYVVSWSATRFTKAITQDLVARFLYAPTGTFGETSPAKTIERLSNINRVAEFYGGQSRLMFIDLPFALIFLVLMGLIGGWLVVVPFVILCLFGFATITSSRQYKRILEEKEEHEARSYDFVAETLSGILTMKSQSAEALLMRRFERLQANNAKLHYSIITAAMRGQSIASLLGNGTMIAMVTTGAFLAVQGKMTVGVLACCSLLSGRAVQPILRVASTWNEFQRARLSVDEVSKLFELKDIPEAAAVEEDPPTPEVVAKNMTIELGETGRNLENLTFQIEPGEVIAIAGVDGSGKTSLLTTMAGLNRPTSGEITLDGIPAYDFRRHYKSAVGISDSNTEVFAGTIFENLSLYGQGGSAEEVRWATDIVSLEKEIDRLPHGYDTPLGQGIAETLPAGFISRLLLARILAQKPVLWVLDEPQDMLDSQGEQSLLKAIESLRGWITFAYTTKSEKLMSNADRIFHIAEGRLTVYDDLTAMNEALAQNDFDRLVVEGEEPLAAPGNG